MKLIPVAPHVSETLGGGEIGENRRYALLRLGLGCNVACPFCNVPWESYDYPMKLSLKDIERELRRLADGGADCLELSGGEPTLRPDLADIIIMAKGIGFRRVELQTNAILLGRSFGYCSRLRDAGLTHAFVGFHSHIAKVHDFLVKRSGAFPSCVSGILNLIGADVETTVNPVVTTVNYKTLPNFMDYVAERLHGVKSVSLSVIQPHGRALNNRKLIPRYGDISPYVEKALDRADVLGLVINNPFCGLPLCVGGWHKRLTRNVEYCEALLGHKPGDGQKFHPTVCGSCSLVNFCGGVWKEYPLIHPRVDLTPIIKMAK
ncbi:MAG: radical SAM protein [Elusimicrobiota bacterium]